MAKALHLICRREPNGRLANLEAGREKGTYRSGYWDLHIADGEGLVGGWIYLHATKAKPSEFGGLVRSVEPAIYEGGAREDRIVFVFEARREGRDQRWRGQDHGMAWTGRLVDADLPHERDGSPHK